MESIIPSRYPILRLRKCVLALTVGLAAILLPAAVAFADVPKQGEIDKVLAKLAEAETQARDNVPTNSRVKRAEDALDAAKRAEMDAQDALQAAKDADANTDAAEATLETAKDAAKQAEADADATREDVKQRTSATQKERAQKYREALAKRREARRTMIALHAELRNLVGPRRGHLGDVKDVEVEIGRLQTRIDRSSLPIVPGSVAGLKLFQSTKANVATDSQKQCTFGKATPTSVAFEPSDDDGNPLKEKLDAKLKEAMKVLFPGAPAPINISNPDPDAPKQEKPGKSGAGPTTAAGGPSAPDAKAPDAKSPTKTEAASAPPTGPATSGAPVTPPSGKTAGAPPPSSLPKRPPDTGLDPVKLPTGELAEDVIDSLAKGAAEAEARGDYGTLELYRAYLETLSWWIANDVFNADQSKITKLLWSDKPGDRQLAKIMNDAALALSARWIIYARELAYWKHTHRESQAAKPGSTTEKSDSSPVTATGPAASGPPTSPPPLSILDQIDESASSPRAKPDADATPSQPAAPGEKSASAPEKLKSSEKTEPGDKRSSGIQKSNQSSQPPEKSTEKAEPGDKTPSSGAAAYPEKAAGNTVHITIHFKVTETALQGGGQGDEIKEQSTKLTALEPPLPKTGQTKTAKAKLDQGHDRGPVTCTTGPGGRCKAQVPADERESYGLPTSPIGTGLQDKPAAVADGDPLQAQAAILEDENYSVALSLPKISGMVIQKGPAKLTSAQLAALTDAPPGVQVEKTDIKIGNRTFTRVGFSGPETTIAALAKKFADLFGKDVQIDFCIEKAPGPPLGMTPVSFSALNNELPLATLDLRRRIQAGGTSK